MTTNNEEPTQTLLAILHSIAPEIEPQDIAPNEPLRDQVDLDSLDWLNFLIKIDKAFSIEISESAYPQLRTLNDIVRYLTPIIGEPEHTQEHSR